MVYDLHWQARVEQPEISKTLGCTRAVCQPLHDAPEP